MTKLIILGMFLVTITSLSAAVISINFIIKHFTLVIDYLNEKEIDPYEKDE